MLQKIRTAGTVPIAIQYAKNKEQENEFHIKYHLLANGVLLTQMFSLFPISLFTQNN